MQEYLDGLKSNLIYIKHIYKKKVLQIYCETKIEANIKVHEKQERVVKDLPFGEYKVELHILAKRFYKDEEARKTVSEKFKFINDTGRRTKRLDKKILEINKETNTIGAERLLKDNFADVSDTTILRMIKKTNQK